MSDEIYFYKENDADQIWWVDNMDRVGLHLFSFDKKKIYNLMKLVTVFVKLLMNMVLLLVVHVVLVGLTPLHCVTQSVLLVSMALA